MRRVVSKSDLREFRERVCTTATELLAERGYEGFKMRELAARLGVSAMTTYRYFDNKSDIFAALRAQAFNALADRLEQLVDLPGQQLASLVAFCRGYVDFACEEPIRYRLMFDHCVPPVADPTELTDAQRRMFRALVDRAGLLERAGALEASPERLARTLWASLHGLAALTLAGACSESESDDLILDMIHGFAGSSGPARTAEGPSVGLYDRRETELDRPQ